jgi:hypothetical protein
MQQFVNRRAVSIFLAGRALIDVIDIRDMQKSSFFQTDIDKSGFHSREHPIDSAFINIADDATATLTFDANFLQGAIFDYGNPGFLGSYIYQYFFIYQHN